MEMPCRATVRENRAARLNRGGGTHRCLAGSSILFLVVAGFLAAGRAWAAQPGDIIAADGRRLFSIKPTTGIRTVLSDFSNAAQGPTGSSFRVATGPGGVIYVTDGASDQMSKL